LKKIFVWIDRGVEYAVAAIFDRHVRGPAAAGLQPLRPQQSISWSEEFQIYCHVWIVS